MKWLNRHADLIVCGTEFVSNDFHKLESALGLPRRETFNSGYGVDLEAMPVSAGLPKIYDVVHLGRIHAHKGVFDLAPIWQKVVQAVPSAKLLMIGEGPHRPAVEKMFAGLGLGNSVTFTGGINEEEKNKLLCQSRIGLSLSHEEGWGLSINEFLGARLPVVAYGLPIFEVVFPGQLVSVSQNDQAAAAARIIDLLGNPALQADLGERGRKFVQRYDYRQVAKEELGALQRLFA